MPDGLEKKLDIRDFGYTTSNMSSTPDLRDVDTVLEMPELNIAPRNLHSDPQDKAREANIQMPGIVSRIRQSNKIGFAERGVFGGGDGALERASVPQGTRFTRNDVPISQAYDRLNNGNYVPRYKNFVADSNNEERLAKRQGFWEKMGNGIAKLALKTGIYAAGGVINPAYGLIEAMRTGNFDAVYNNDFMKFMDDLDVRTNYALPNYYTNEEKNKSFLGKMGTANFWANDVLGGMAYTFGALASEALWTGITGGASIAGTAGRAAMRAAGRNMAKEGLAGIGKRFFSDIKGVSNAYLRQASKASNVAAALNNARFLYTSAGWEASVESFHFMKDAEINFVESYKNMYGRRPSVEEMDRFRESVTNSGNAVFAANVGIVGLSNIIQFGQYFGVGGDFTKGLDRSINKFFGVGVKMNKAGKLEQITSSKLRKGLGTTFNVLKRPFTEGVWEEGTQGVVSKAADAWIASRFDPDASRQNINFMESIGQGFKETYGTKEGRMEIGIGAIIGGVMGVAGGRSTGFGGFTEIKQANERIGIQVEKYNEMDIPKAAINLATRTAYTNQQISAAMEGAAAEEVGDKYASKQAYNKSLFTKFKMDYEFGLLEDSAENFRHVISQMSDTDLATEYNISVEEAQKMKEDIIADYNERLEDFKSSEKYAESLLSGSKSSIKKDYISLNLFLGTQSYRNMRNAAEDIAGMMNDPSISSAIMYYSELSDEGRKLYRERDEIVSEISSLEEEVQKINSLITEEGQREKYAKKAERLTELNNRINEIDSELAHYNTRFSPIDFISRVRLSEYNGMVDPSALGSSFSVLKNLDAYIYALNKNRSKGDIARANLLNALVEDFTQSYSDFRSVNDMISRMQDPRFMAKEDARIMKLFRDAGQRFYEDEDRRPEGVITLEDESKIDDELAEGKISEEEAYTLKTFIRMQEGFLRPESTTDIISDEDWSGYESSDADTTSRLMQGVRDNIFNDMNLSPRQQQIYNEHKGEIDDMVKSLGDSPLQRLNELKRKVEEANDLRFNDAEQVNEYVINQALLSEPDSDYADEIRNKIDQYKELMDKYDDESISSDELYELMDLMREISDFGESHGVDRILDFVDQNRMMAKGFTAFSPTKSVTDYGDLVDHHEPSDTGGEPVFDNAQNIKMLTVKPNSDGTYQVVSGMKMQKFIDLMVDKLGAVQVGNKRNEEGARVVNVYGVEVKLYTGDHESVMISNADVEMLQNKALENGRGFIFNLQPALASATSRELLFYDESANGKVEIIRADVSYGKEGTDIIKDQDVIETKVGDRLIARIDFSDSYNKGLWKEYQKQLTRKNGAIADLNREPNNKIFQDNAKLESEKFEKIANRVRNNLVIKLVNNEGGLGRFVSVVKAMTDSMAGTPSGMALMEVREKAFKDFVANAGSRESGYMDIGTYAVRRTLPGRPTLKMNIDPSTKNITVEGHRIQPSDVDKFVSVGYILNGRAHIKDRGIKFSNYPFVSNVIREGKKNGDKYFGVKVPVVIIKHPNGTNYAYPVDVIANNTSLKQDLIDTIDLVSSDISYISREDIMSINTEAMRLGVSPSNTVRIAGLYSDIVSDLTRLRGELESMSDRMDVEGWLSGSRSTSDILTEDVMINLDLSSPFHAPKIVVDLSGSGVTPVIDDSSKSVPFGNNNGLSGVVNDNDMTQQNKELNTKC